MKSVFIYQIFTLMGAISWGLMSLATIPLGQMGLSSTNLTFLRMAFSLIFAGLILLVTPKKFKIKLKHLPLFIAMGAAGYMLTSILNILSIQNSGAGIAAMLMNTAPIWLTILAAIFFKEKITWLKIVCLLGLLGGCACLCLGDVSTFSLIGVLAGLGAGVTFALFCFLGKFATLNGYSTQTTNFYVFVFASISAIPFANFSEIGSVISADVTTSILYILLLALGFTVIPSMLYNLGLKKVPSSTAGMLEIAEPLTASVIGFTVFGEPITPLGIVGMVVIVASLILLQLSYRQKPLHLIEENPKNDNSSPPPPSDIDIL